MNGTSLRLGRVADFLECGQDGVDILKRDVGLAFGVEHQAAISDASRRVIKQGEDLGEG
jgi:hypothetical protein